MPTKAKSEGMHLKVVLEPSEEGGYTVFVPALPGCISEGDTKAQALRNIKEAVTLYLEDAPSDSAIPAGAEVAEIVV